MVEDGIPEILFELRLGHEVPGMRMPFRALDGNLSETGCVSGLPSTGGVERARRERGSQISPKCPQKRLRPRRGRSLRGQKVASGPAFQRGGRYWDRTSDLFGVNEALSR